MALEPLVWALNDSPVKDTTERLVLGALADKADPDGCNAFPSKRTIASVALCDEKTVQRKLADMRKRKIIDYGDQAAARYIEARYRPKVYDLLIPASWYGPERLERVNRDRAAKGLPPLTNENRPPIDPPPAKKERSDKGVPRQVKKTAAKKTTAAKKAAASGPREQGGHTVPPERRAGGTDSPRSGGTENPSEGGLRVPQTVPSTHPEQPAPASRSVRPSVQEGEAENDGGNGPADALKHSQGAALLVAFGSTEPLYMLRGQTLTEQAANVDELLARGWKASVVRGVLGSNLPTDTELKVGPAALIAYRIRSMLHAPVPGPDETDVPAPRAEWEEPVLSTTEAARRSVPAAIRARRWAECPGNDGMCGKLPVEGQEMCAECLGWPKCSGCGHRFGNPGTDSLCRVCVEQGAILAKRLETVPPPF